MTPAVCHAESHCCMGVVCNLHLSDLFHWPSTAEALCTVSSHYYLIRNENKRHNYDMHDCKLPAAWSNIIMCMRRVKPCRGVFLTPCGATLMQM